MYGYRKIHLGGNFSDFVDYTTESGVVLEEKVPYNFYEYKEDEYMKFSDMNQEVEVTETVDFHSLYKFQDSEYTDEQISEFRIAVKKHIMKNGGLYTAIVSVTNSANNTVTNSTVNNVINSVNNAVINNTVNNIGDTLKINSNTI